MRQYKCYYCKQIINNDLVEFEVGDKRKIIKRAHKECRENKIKHDQIYDTICFLLEIPAIEDSYTKKTINQLYERYGYDVMMHALKAKYKVMADNFSKGWGYVFGILKAQLPISYKEVNKPKPKIIIEDDVQKITVRR